MPNIFLNALTFPDTQCILKLVMSSSNQNPHYLTHMNPVTSLMSFYFLSTLHVSMPCASRGNCMICFVHVVICSLSFLVSFMCLKQNLSMQTKGRKCYQEDRAQETSISAEKFGDCYEVKHRNSLWSLGTEGRGQAQRTSMASHRLNNRANMHHSQTWSNGQTS